MVMRRSIDDLWLMLDVFSEIRRRSSGRHETTFFTICPLTRSRRVAAHKFNQLLGSYSMFLCFHYLFVCNSSPTSAWQEVSVGASFTLLVAGTAVEIIVRDKAVCYWVRFRTQTDDITDISYSIEIHKRFGTSSSERVIATLSQKKRQRQQDTSTDGGRWKLENTTELDDESGLCRMFDMALVKSFNLQNQVYCHYGHHPPPGFACLCAFLLSRISLWVWRSVVRVFHSKATLKKRCMPKPLCPGFFFLVSFVICFISSTSDGLERKINIHDSLSSVE